MAATKRFIIVGVLTVVWLCLLLWLILAGGSAAKVGSNPLLPVVLILLAILPLYPLYRFAKKWPHLSLGHIHAWSLPSSDCCRGIRALLAQYQWPVGSGHVQPERNSMRREQRAIRLAGSEEAWVSGFS
jgi:hypothetical protein